MLRWLGAAALALAAGVGLVFAFVSPPGLLSFVDGIAGGGSGVIRAGGSIPFGTHGQRLDLWRPAGQVTERPVLVFWYGGGWDSGDRRAYSFAARALAREGFVVVVPDYRKVPSARYPSFVQDGAEALQWVRDNITRYGGDVDQVAIMGHSAGAHTVAMLSLDQQWLRAVDVPDDFIKAAVGLAGPYDFYPFTSPQAIAAMAGADPKTTQPVNYARADAPPLLLITSDSDTVVRPRNAIHLHDRLRAQGARVQIRMYSGVDHREMVTSLSKPFRDRATSLRDSVDFIRQELRAPRVSKTAS